MAKGPSMYSDLPSLDPSKVATDHLNSLIDDEHIDELEGEGITVLDERIKERQKNRETEETQNLETPEESVMQQKRETIDSKTARTGARLLEHESDRNGIRLLIFTRNETVTARESIMQRRILAFAQVFSEIHIVVLSYGKEDAHETLRIADNVWVYKTNSPFWWKTGFDAYRIAKEQLTFAGGFRADIILAEDPFESGVVGHYIAERYGRPLQIHVLEDFYDPAFRDHEDHNAFRVHMAHFSLKRADSVRTKSDFLQKEIVADYPNLRAHTEILPIYHNLDAWRDLEPTFSLHERYPQFKFIILHISSMQTSSHTIEVIESAEPILKRYPTIGLVIVGNGPLRSVLEKRVISLGIHNQVEFEPTPSEVISHMKTANVLIHLSENPEEDPILLEAASVRLPMITGIAGLASELFTNDESAFMCQNIDTNCVSERINQFLNNNQSRARLALNAQETVFERIEQDYTAYLDAYRGSIERGVSVVE